MPGIQHALLSASAAKRWLNCPPSARLTADMPESQSAYAAEGTLAHELCELKLRKKFEALKKSEYDKRARSIQSNALYQPEMDGYTDDYLDYVLGIAHGYESKPYIVIEKRLDFSHVVPEGFGTGDCLMMVGEVLHVIDFKYGKGVSVSAEDNPQMMLYAIGALQEYSFLFPLNKVVMHIVQPRLENFSRCEITVDALNARASEIKPIAEQAIKGEGEYKCGDWCRFCKAKATCRARADSFKRLEAFGQSLPPLIDNAQVGEILNIAENLKNWVADLEEYALAELLLGNDVPGWKAVEGRSNRTFTDIDKAFETLKASGFDEALLYERKPITLTNAEKLVGKKQFSELVGAYINKPQGKPTLAPENDKREPVKPNLEEMFGGEK